MTRQRRRSTAISVHELEGRRLPSAQGPTGVWLGQDGHDFIGATPGAPPDGVQDIHIAVSGLPANLTVVKTETDAYGGGQWIDYIQPAAPSWAAWIQAPGSTTADLYLEPYMVETGRQFATLLTFNDGSTALFYVQGGTADPNLRMPDTSVAAQWVGQNGTDVTGPGPDVGPDGIQDVEVDLSNLSTTSGSITAINVTSPSGTSWSYGTNPQLAWNAEFAANPADATQGRLWIAPAAGLQGQTLTVSVAYANGKTDQTTLVAGASNPNLTVPPPAPVSVNWGTIAASWVGQDGLNLVGPGDVHLSLTGLNPARTVVSATLSDGEAGDWIYESNGTAAAAVDPSALPLGFARSATDPTRADLTFPPIRDETGATLTLTVVLDDGTILATRLAGGPSDPGLRAPDIAPTSIVASPGDDLSTLVNEYGTVHLSAGTYALSQPLYLEHPVTITADPGAILLFSQAAGDPAWTTAIDIECGHTTLDGFAVRFAGPINWTTNVNSGPAVIGNSYQLDGGIKTTLVDIALTHLDLLSPPPSTTWEEAPHLIWMANAQSGVISGNTLKGGTTEFSNGPWTITSNNYEGTVPNTYCDVAFGGHYTFDLVVANNTVEPVGDSGKTWRFLTLTQEGHNDVIENNNVVGIGPMDNDTVPNPNSSETILTEAYRLHFEGAPAAISPDGLIVQIPAPQGGAARTGDVVSILAGPDAGQWRRIAQALSPTAYLLDAPISTADTAISISTGFVDETFEGNTINATGSSTALDLVLAGNHFGTQVLNNTFIGGGEAMVLWAAATEQPDIWSWSRAPFLGATIAGNTIQDVKGGVELDVVHSSAMKTSAGRTYMSFALDHNTVVWSAAFMAAMQQAGAWPPPTITVGDTLSNDPSAILVTAQGNTIQAPPGAGSALSWLVDAATVNGQPMVNQQVAFASPLTAPTGLALVVDSGASATDHITNNGELRFDADPSVAGYEYSLTGQDGSYVSVPSPSGFLPAGLQQGTNTIDVRSYDAAGNRGPVASITIDYETTRPGPILNLTATPAGVVEFSALAPGDVYAYQLGGAGAYVPLGTSTSFTAPGLMTGPRTVQVHAIDLAGNIGPDSITTLMPQWVAATHQPVSAPTSAPKTTTPPPPKKTATVPAPPAVAPTPPAHTGWNSRPLSPALRRRLVLAEIDSLLVSRRLAIRPNVIVRPEIHRPLAVRPHRGRRG